MARASSEAKRSWQSTPLHHPALPGPTFGILCFARRASFCRMSPKPAPAVSSCPIYMKPPKPESLVLALGLGSCVLALADNLKTLSRAFLLASFALSSFVASFFWSAGAWTSARPAPESKAPTGSLDVPDGPFSVLSTKGLIPSLAEKPCS